MDCAIFELSNFNAFLDTLPEEGRREVVLEFEHWKKTMAAVFQKVHFDNGWPASELKHTYEDFLADIDSWEDQFFLLYFQQDQETHVTCLNGFPVKLLNSSKFFFH